MSRFKKKLHFFLRWLLALIVMSIAYFIYCQFLPQITSTNNSDSLTTVQKKTADIQSRNFLSEQTNHSSDVSNESDESESKKQTSLNNNTKTIPNKNTNDESFQAETTLNSIPVEFSYIKDLLIYLYPDENSWQRIKGRLIQTKDNSALLIFDQYNISPQNGQLTLSQCSIVYFTKKYGEVPLEDWFSSAIVFDSAGTVVLNFAKSKNTDSKWFQNMDLDLFTGGEFYKKVVIRSKLERNDPNDDFYLEAQNVTFNLNQIFVRGAVSFSLGDCTGDGEGLTIEFTLPKKEDKKDSLFPSNLPSSTFALSTSKKNNEQEEKMFSAQRFFGSDGNFIRPVSFSGQMDAALSNSSASENSSSKKEENSYQNFSNKIFVQRIELAQLGHLHIFFDEKKLSGGRPSFLGKSPESTEKKAPVQFGSIGVQQLNKPSLNNSDSGYINSPETASALGISDSAGTSDTFSNVYVNESQETAKGQTSEQIFGQAAEQNAIRSNNSYQPNSPDHLNHLNSLNMQDIQNIQADQYKSNYPQENQPSEPIPVDLNQEDVPPSDLEKPLKTELDISSQNGFTLKPNPSVLGGWVATFMDNVEIVGFRPNEESDRLKCQNLYLYFVDQALQSVYGTTETQQFARGETVPTGNLANLEINSLKADGYPNDPAQLTCPQFIFSAQGEQIIYDMKNGKVSLLGLSVPAILQQNKMSLQADAVHYFIGSEHDFGRIYAEGKGEFSGIYGNSQKQSEFKTSWTQQLQVAPDANNSSLIRISLNGNVSFNFDFGSVSSESADFWLKNQADVKNSSSGADFVQNSNQTAYSAQMPVPSEMKNGANDVIAPKTAAAEPLNFFSQKMDIIPIGAQFQNNVSIQFEKGLCEIEKKVNLCFSPFSDASNSEANSLTNQSLTNQNLATNQLPINSMPENTLSENNQGINPPSLPSSFLSSPKTSQKTNDADILGKNLFGDDENSNYLLKGEELDLWIALSEKKTVISRIFINKNISLTETPIGQTEPTLIVSGSEVSVNSPASPQMTLDLKGNAALFQGKGLTLRGRFINIDRGANSFSVLGVGTLIIRSDFNSFFDISKNGIDFSSDQGAAASSVPSVDSGKNELRIRWNKKMSFDGQTLSFQGSPVHTNDRFGNSGGIFASGWDGQRTIRCSQLDISLNEKIDIFGLKIEKEGLKPRWITCSGIPDYPVEMTSFEFVNFLLAAKSNADNSSTQNPAETSSKSVYPLNQPGNANPSDLQIGETASGNDQIGLKIDVRLSEFTLDLMTGNFVSQGNGLFKVSFLNSLIKKDSSKNIFETLKKTNDNSEDKNSNKPEQKWGHLILSCQGGLTGNIFEANGRKITAERQVETLHWSSDNQDITSISLDDPKNYPSESIHMICQKMELLENPLLQGTGSRELIASDNARFRCQDFIATGDSIKYSENKNNIVLTGTPKNPAALYYQKSLGNEFQLLKKSEKIQYNLTTKKIEIEKLDGIDLIPASFQERQR